MQTRLFLAGPNSPLTESGERLQQGVGTHFVGIDRALADLGSPGIRVRLSTVATFAALWLIPRLADFTSRHPDIRLSVGASRRVVRLGAEPFDCSIRWGRGDWRDQESLLLFREELILVGSPAQAGADHAFAQPRIGALTRPDDWPSFLKAAGEGERQPHLIVEDRASAVQAAALGLGVTVVDRTLVRYQLMSGNLAQLSPVACALDDGFHFISSPSGAAQGAVDALRSWISQSVRRERESAMPCPQ